jgi:chromate transporter
MLVMTPISVVLTARYGDRFAAKPQAAPAQREGKKEGAQ